MFAGLLPVIHTIFSKNESERQKMLVIKDMNALLIAFDVIITIPGFAICILVFKLNTIYTMILLPLIIGVVHFIYEKGKIKDVLFTVAVSLFITVFAYNMIILIYPDVINNHFLLSNVTGIKILRVPLEEWLFSITLGIGSTYIAQ